MHTTLLIVLSPSPRISDLPTALLNIPVESASAERTGTQWSGLQNSVQKKVSKLAFLSRNIYLHVDAFGIPYFRE